jgi:hypothetical protein
MAGGTAAMRRACSAGADGLEAAGQELIWQFQEPYPAILDGRWRPLFAGTDQLQGQSAGDVEPWAAGLYALGRGRGWNKPYTTAVWR